MNGRGLRGLKEQRDRVPHPEGQFRNKGAMKSGEARRRWLRAGGQEKQGPSVGRAGRGGGCAGGEVTQRPFSPLNVHAFLRPSCVGRPLAPLLSPVRHWDRGWRWTPRPRGKRANGLRPLTLPYSYSVPFSAASSTCATSITRSGLHWDPGHSPV